MTDDRLADSPRRRCIRDCTYKTSKYHVIYMAVYERFEDLPVWQEAARLYNLALDLLQIESVRLLDQDGGFSLKEQRSQSRAILRRALSVLRLTS